MYLNRITVIGRLVAAPDYTKGSKEDGSNDRVWGRIACNRPGSDEADFICFVCWGKTARAVAKYCGKGKILILDGRLATRSKLRADGTHDNYAEVNCSAVYFGPDAKNVTPDVAAQPAVATPAAMPAPAQGQDAAAQVASLLMGLLGQAAPAQQAVVSGPPSDSDNPFA